MTVAGSTLEDLKMKIMDITASVADMRPERRYWCWQLHSYAPSLAQKRLCSPCRFLMKIVDKTEKSPSRETGEVWSFHKPA
jgi:hypothetical protein